MRSPLGRARTRLALPTGRFGRLGVTGAFGVAALLVILIIGAVLDLSASRAGQGRLASYIETGMMEPVEAIAAAARTHRIIFLADIHGAAGTKRLAADAVEEIASTVGLDAVVLDIASDAQAYIDRYIDTSPENTASLLSNPAVLRESSPASREFLELYRRIWRINQKLGADRRISVYAADAPGWPPSDAVSPAAFARRYAQRDSMMLEVIERRIFSRNPRARILIFMGGFHGLKGGRGMLQTGGTAPADVTWLVTRLQARHPGEVMTFLTDAATGRTNDDVAEYVGTRIPEFLGDDLPRRSFAVRINDAFDAVADPLVERDRPGLDFEVLPRGYNLRDVADTWIRIND